MLTVSNKILVTKYFNYTKFEIYLITNFAAVSATSSH